MILINVNFVKELSLSNLNNLETLGIGFIFLLLTTILIPIIGIIRDNREEMYYLLLVELLLIMLFKTKNLLTFYINFELILIPLLLLIIIFGSRYNKLDAYYKLWYYAFVGSLLLLLTIIYIYLNLGSLNNNMIYLYLNRSDRKLESYLIWLGIIVSFLIKVPIVPFHNWLTIAHTEASTLGSVLLASLILKISTFGIIQYNTLLLWVTLFNPLIIMISILSLLYSCIIIIYIIDIKLIIAYSSIIHMNYSLLSIFNSVNGKLGTIYSNISHGIVSSSLFILIGILYRRYHSRIIYYYKGLVTVMPLFSIVFFVFIISNMSLPLTSSFIGEFWILRTFLNENLVLVIIPLICLFFNTLFNITLYNKVIYSSLSNYLLKYKDISLLEWISLIPLIIYNLWLGLAPNGLILIITSLLV